MVPRAKRLVYNLVVDPKCINVQQKPQIKCTKQYSQQKHWMKYQNHMSQCKPRTQWRPSLNKMNSSAAKSTKWKWGETPWHKGQQTTNHTQIQRFATR